jgi:single-strand DNA-binding protein
MGRNEGSMAQSVNQVTLLGNLGRDPEVRSTQGGQSVANFSMATSEQWSDKTTGEKKEKTTWSRVVVWGKIAELCGQFLHKGSKVYVQGRLQNREWTDKEGNKKETTEIVADTVVFLDKKSDGAPAEQGGKRDEAPPPDDGSIPF